MRTLLPSMAWHMSRRNDLPRPRPTLNIATRRSELVLGSHPRDVYTARLPSPEWKERESFGYKFSVTRRRISLS